METLDAWAAVGDRTRRKILERVLDRPSSVTDLARDLPVSRPAVSQHLQILLRADLVKVHPHGRQRIYSASLEGLESLRRELDGFWTQALTTFKHLAENGDRPRETPHDRNRA